MASLKEMGGTGDATHRSEIDAPPNPKCMEHGCQLAARRSEQRTQCPTCGQVIPLHTELQRSEQEWTVERIASYIGTKPYQQFADDINAALDAERQLREQAEHERDLARIGRSQFYNELLSAQNGELTLRDETHRCEIDYDEAYNERARSTPRESRSPFSQRSEQTARTKARAILADGKWSHNHYTAEQMEDLITKAAQADSARLREAIESYWKPRLLSALAAIKKARNTVYAERRDEILNSVDLSALDEHDTKVREAENKRMMEFWQGEHEIQERKRKPLVDLLTRVKAHLAVFVTNEPLRCEIVDVLAKVKHETNKSQ